MSETSKTIGFLGAGQMATALAGGWLRQGLLSAEQVRASDPSEAAREHFAETTGARVIESNAEVVRNSEVIILAVKPQFLSGLLKDVRNDLKDHHLIVSIAAGMSLEKLEDQVYVPHPRIVRVMPNTPCLVGAMAAGYSVSEGATEEDVALIDRLLNAVGKAYRMPEHLLAAITGLSGSGPAFVAMMIDAMTDGGVRMGLPRDVALTLSAQTVMGTGKLLLEMGLTAGEAKDMVTSPGGTTIAGLHQLEKAAFRGAIMDAVEAATRRAEELGKD